MLQRTWNEQELYPSGLRWQERLQELASTSSGSTRQNQFLAGAQSFDARGWPMLALQAHWDGNDKDDPVHSWNWGIAISGDVTNAGGGVVYQNFKALALRPIWPGFAINTTFYAAILWMLFAFPFTVRRWHRRRRINRGLCPACAYPVGTNPHCTECGKPLKHPAT
jgi:hypothetical protein